MNPQLIDALAVNLEDEVDVQNRLLEALRAQRKRLLDGASEEMDSILVEIRALLDRADRNRGRRAALLRALGVRPEDEEPVERVARAAPPPAGERLRGLRRVLVGAAAEVRSLNRFNAQLVRRSAELIEGLLRVFTGVGDMPGYGHSGAPRRLRPDGVLLNAEV
jgi:flagellar biosynthesis/type III secretory pathway chaperone